MTKRQLPPPLHGKNWKGGRRASGGYILVWMPEHPRGTANGDVYEHLLIAERALGKPLPRRCQVHHVDSDGHNNAPNNLVVCEDLAYHKLLHKRQRALDACGNANAKRCIVCRSYDRQEDIVSQVHRHHGKPSERTFHPACRRAAHRAWRQLKKEKTYNAA